MLEKSKKAWDSKLRMEVWEDRITVKKSTGRSPFELVYGAQDRIPMQNLLPAYKFILQEDLDILEPMEDRMEQLVELDEIRRLAQEQNTQIESQVKYLFDKREKDKKFNENDMVLLWNTRCQDKGKHGKFEGLWIGPFVITSLHCQMIT